MSQLALETSVAYLLTKMFKKPAEEFGNLLSDRLKYLRILNVNELNARLDTKLKARGIVDTREVKLKFGIPLLEAASLEDNPALQELYATLLANAMDPNYDPQNIRYAYIDIIKGLEPIDAQILQFCYDTVLERARKTPVADEPTRVFGILQSASIEQHIVEKELRINPEALTQGVYNLIRMSCVQFLEKLAVWDDARALVDMASLPRPFHLTPLGYNFVKACIV